MERRLGEMAKIIITGRVERVQQAKRLEQVERDVIDLRENADVANHDLAGVDDRINDMATELESLRRYLKLGD